MLKLMDDGVLSQSETAKVLGVSRAEPLERMARANLPVVAYTPTTTSANRLLYSGCKNSAGGFHNPQKRFRMHFRLAFPNFCTVRAKSPFRSALAPKISFSSLAWIVEIQGIIGMLTKSTNNQA